MWHYQFEAAKKGMYLETLLQWLKTQLSYVSPCSPVLTSLVILQTLLPFTPLFFSQLKHYISGNFITHLAENKGLQKEY